MSNFPGLELLFSSVESKLKSNFDALICVIHWNLINQGFKCVGLGESASASSKKTELLPKGWNASQEEFSLRYEPQDSADKYVLKCIVMGDTLLVNLMRLKDEKVTSLSLDTDQFIDKEHLKDFDRVYKDGALLRQLIITDLISPIKSKRDTASSTQATSQTTQQTPQTQERQRETDPLRDTNPLRDIDPLRGPVRLPGQRGNPERGLPDDPFSVGRSDLDPFRPGGSGMLMDPFRGGMPHRGIDPGIGYPGRLPPGSVPPGARFDPIGPPRPGGPGGGPQGGFVSGPDPDHLPPPGYDDMFM